jgi:hypothetical protein
VSTTRATGSGGQPMAEGHRWAMVNQGRAGTRASLENELPRLEIPTPVGNISGRSYPGASGTRGPTQHALDESGSGVRRSRLRSTVKYASWTLAHATELSRTRPDGLPERLAAVSHVSACDCPSRDPPNALRLANRRSFGRRATVRSLVWTAGLVILNIRGRASDYTSAWGRTDRPWHSP